MDIRRDRMRRFSAIAQSWFAPVGIALLLVPTPSASAEVDFPPQRETVGVDEYYRLDRFDDWTVWCRRDAGNLDHCEAVHSIADLDAGIALEFSVVPILDFTEPVNATVDVWPRAMIVISTTSTAPHYANLMAYVSTLDGVVFDGYACAVTDIDNCQRGPELVLQDSRAVTAAKRAGVTVVRLDNGQPVSRIEVSLEGLAGAYRRANAFNASIHGLDLSDTRNLAEMCNFAHNGRERRISFFLDPDVAFSQPSRSERWWGPRGGADCPSYVILSYFTPDMTPAQRAHFCLEFDRTGGGYLGARLGEADRYRICRQPGPTLCERSNHTQEVALATLGAVWTITEGIGTVVTEPGVHVVAHSSGKAILTGSAGYISGTIGLPAELVALLTGPEIPAAAALAVVAVGGAVYLCKGPTDEAQ